MSDYVWGSYTLTVSKNGVLVKTVEYTGMSGAAMMDEAHYLRFQYPASDGFTIDW